MSRNPKNREQESRKILHQFRKKLYWLRQKIELELLYQAQSLLDQLLMDMWEVNQELETELRECGNKVKDKAWKQLKMRNTYNS